MNVQARGSGHRGKESFFRRTGWIGTTLLIGAGFFLIGALVSLLNSDMSVAIQGFIVAGLLVAASVYVVRKRDSR